MQKAGRKRVKLDAGYVAQSISTPSSTSRLPEISALQTPQSSMLLPKMSDSTTASQVQCTPGDGDSNAQLKAESLADTSPISQAQNSTVPTTSRQAIPHVDYTKPGRNLYEQPASYDSSSWLPRLEANFMRDFACCGQTLSTLHDLLQHYEETHVHSHRTPQHE